MSGKSERTAPRVDYRVPVAITRAEGPENQAIRVSGYSHDLSIAGLGLVIDAGTTLHAGEHVQCQLRVGGLPATLPGTIAWFGDNDGSAPRGGLCFDGLPEREQALLQQAVSAARAGGRPITLHFVDMGRRMEAQALADRSGVRVRAPFPMLAEGSRVALDQGAQEQAAGFVSEVQLDRSGPIPVLEFRVNLQSSEAPVQSQTPTPPPTLWTREGSIAPGAPRQRRQSPDLRLQDPDEHQGTDDPEPLDSVEATGTAAAAQRGPVDSEPPPIDDDAATLAGPAAPPKSPAPRLTAPHNRRNTKAHNHNLRTRGIIFASLVGGAALCGILWPVVQDLVLNVNDRGPSSPSSAATTDAEPNSSANAPPYSAGSDAGDVAKALELGVPHDLGTDGESDYSAAGTDGKPGRSTSHPQAPSSASDGPTPTATTPSSGATANGASPENSATLEAKPQRTTPAQPVLTEPKVAVQGNRTTIRVPLKGPGSDAQVTLWVDPQAVAVTIPAGSQVTLVPKRYSIKYGHIGQVRIGQPDKGTDMVVHVTRPVRRHKLQTMPGYLELDLEF